MATLFKRFSPDLYEVRYSVEEDEDGLRLDKYLSRFFPSFSREQIKKKIAKGEVEITGRPHPHKPNSKVYLGEEVYIFTPRGELEDEYWNGEKLPLPEPTLLVEKDGILVVNKPPYMTTHPTGKHLFYSATVFFEHKYNQTIHSVHRLDRETSGVQLLAMNPQTAKKYTDAFEQNVVHKAYFLIAHKKSSPAFPFTAKERMDHDPNFIPRVYVHCYPENSKKGKTAQTEFHLIHEEQDYLLVVALPKTGRQHQIRTHAAHHGFPLLGDKIYNGDPTIFMRFKDLIPTPEDHEILQIPRHALHAMGLKLPDQDVFFAPLPYDFKQWISENLAIDLDQLEQKLEFFIKETLNGR